MTLDISSIITICTVLISGILPGPLTESQEYKKLVSEQITQNNINQDYEIQVTENIKNSKKIIILETSKWDLIVLKNPKFYVEININNEYELTAKVINEIKIK